MARDVGGRQIRAAAIGFASGHPNAYHGALARHPRVRLVGVAEVLGQASREALGREFAQANGLPYHEDYRAMLDHTPADMVSLCVTPALNPEVLADVARRGLHVISEKPVADSLAAAEQAISAVESAGVVFSLDAPAACFPRPIRTAHDMVTSGELGIPRVIYSQFLQPKGPRYAFTMEDGKKVAPVYGELQNFGPYAFLAASKAAGASLRSVFARRDAFFYEWYKDAGHEDLCLATAVFGGGTVANILVGRIPVLSLPATDLRLEVVCSKGTVLVDDGMGDKIVVWGPYADGSDPYEMGGVQHRYYSEDPVGAYIDDVVCAVLERRPPRITARDALDIMRFTEGCVQSSRQGQPVHYPA